jgi:hypothetical protein
MPRSDDDRIGRTDPLRDRAMVARSDKVLICFFCPGREAQIAAIAVKSGAIVNVDLV